MIEHNNLSRSIEKNNPNASKSNENSIRSLEKAIIFEKKNYSDYKNEKIKELEIESKRLFNIGDFERAVIIMKKLIFFDPKKSEYFSMLGKIYVKLHDISSAIIYYKKSYLLENQNSFTYRQLENLLFAKGVINLEEGRINKEILKQIKDEMNKCHYYYLKSVAFLSVGRASNAIAELEKILLHEKDHIEANLLLGKIYLSSGRYKESSVHLWRVNKINPEHSEIQQYVSIMKSKMRECLEKANQNILNNKEDMGLLLSTKALVMYPNHPDALMLRSAIFKRIGQFKKSILDLNNAYANMTVDNNSEKVLTQISLTYNELGVQLIKNKNIVEAYKILEEALKFKPDDFITHLNIGDCLLEMKNINKALEEYLIGLSLNPKSVQARSKLAVVYYKFAIMMFNNKEYRDSIGYIDKALGFYPKSAEFFLLRARSYMKISQMKKASEDVNIAFGINPNNKEAMELKKYFLE